MRVILFGATGTIGSAIAAELTQRGHAVVGVSRTGRRVADITSVRGDASDPDQVKRLVEGSDAVVSAIGTRRDGSESPDELSNVAHGLVTGLRRAAVSRLIIVGGAGSLRHGHRRHVDSPGFPVAHRPRALAHAAARDVYFEVKDLDWIYISPADQIEPGPRTGVFRVGGDVLLVDGEGVSRITVPDYAAGVVDQVEHPTVNRKQITLAY